MPLIDIGQNLLRGYSRRRYRPKHFLVGIPTTQKVKERARLLAEKAAYVIKGGRI
ncbi:hypothetical protein TPA0906_44720 [Streptomyces olivaceus]|nr:hypothetical protein TPA0906_44720 [Streptomyces olivaceus]